MSIIKTLRPKVGEEDRVVDLYDTEQVSRSINEGALLEEKEHIEARLEVINADLAIIDAEVAKEK